MEYEKKIGDHYELGHVIGKGGFGAVCAGVCKKTRTPVRIMNKFCVFCLLFVFGGVVKNKGILPRRFVHTLGEGRGGGRGLRSFLITGRGLHQSLVL